MRKLFLTGAVGHIMTNVAIEAIQRGWNVFGMDNLHRDGVVRNLDYLETTFKDKFKFIWGDVRNSEDFEKVPHDIDGCIMGAANPGIPWSIEYPRYDFRTNAEGTVNTLEFIRNCGEVPTAYCSTNKTFSDIINAIPIVEKDTRYEWLRMAETQNPVSVGVDRDEKNRVLSINENFPITGFGKYGHSLYGISKLSGELYCQEYHCEYKIPMVILKMSCIFGLAQLGAIEQGWVSYFIRKIGFEDGDITFFGNGKQVRDVLDARDVAKLYMDCIENIKKCDGEIFTVGGGVENTVSLIEAKREIEKQTRRKARISYAPPRSSDQKIYISSIEKVQRIMKWKPTIKFEQTVHDMIKEYNI